MRRVYHLAVFCIGLGLALFFTEKLLGFWANFSAVTARRVGLLESTGLHLPEVFSVEHLRTWHSAMAILATPLLFCGVILLIYLKWVCRDPVTRNHPAPPPLDDPMLQLQQIYLTLTFFFGSLDDVLEWGFELATMLSVLSSIASIYYYFLYTRRRA